MPPTAELDAPETEVKKAPVTEPGQVSLAEAFKKTLAEQNPVQKEAPKKEPVKKEEPAKAEKQPEAKEVEKEVKKPASALDAVLEKPAEKAAEKQPEEPGADAPAKQLREAYERQKSEAARWKGEAEKASKGDPATKAQLETLRAEKERLAKENAELRDSVTALNVDFDPEVRAKYHDGKATLIDKTVKSVEQFGGDPKAFADAMAMPAGKAQTQAIRDALAEVDEMDRTRIYNSIAKIRDLEEEHADLLKNSQKSYAELTEKQKARMVEQQAHAEKAKLEIFDRVSKEIVSKHPTLGFVGEDIEGHAEWNNGLKETHERALQKLGPDADLEEIIETAIRGERLPFVESLLMDERAVTKQLREELAKYENADAGFDGRHKSDKVSKLDKTPAELYHAKLAELKGSTGD